MIANFTYSNFLSVRESQCLSFEPATGASYNENYLVNVAEGVDLLKVGTIYGANASGKTNILCALTFFRDLFVNVPIDKTSEIDVCPFLLNETSKMEKSKMDMIFYLQGFKYKLTIIFDGKRVYEERLDFYPSSRVALLYSRKYNEKTDSTDIDFGGKLELNAKAKKLLQGNTINNCSVLAAFGKLNIEASKLNVVYDFFRLKLKDILRPNTTLASYTKSILGDDSDGSTKRFIEKFLRASDFNISSIDIQEEIMPITEDMEKMIAASPMPDEFKRDIIAKGSITNQELVFTHLTDNGEFQLPESLESRGTIRYMGLATILKQLIKDDKVIIIDEIETSLHYEILSYLLKVFVANDSGTSQLIFTTHDINLLDEDYIRRDAVWFTHKDSCGETQLSRLSSMSLRNNLSPYNAYKQGKLVDLPFLDSIYLDMED